MVNLISKKYKCFHIHEPFNLKVGLKSNEIINLIENKTSNQRLIDLNWRKSNSKIRILLYRFLIKKQSDIQLVKDPFVFTFFDNASNFLNNFNLIFFVVKDPVHWVKSNINRGGDDPFNSTITNLENSNLAFLCKEFCETKNYELEDQLFMLYILSLKRALKFKNLKFVMCDKSIENNILELNLNSNNFYKISILRRGMMNSGSTFKKSKFEVPKPINIDENSSLCIEAKKLYNKIKDEYINF